MKGCVFFTVLCFAFCAVNEPLPCDTQRCVYGATCINLYGSYVCQCLYGFYYTSSGCQQGKLFPGQVTLNVSYTSEMSNSTTLEYKFLYDNITQFFNYTFQNETSYQGTEILSVKSSSPTSKRLSKAETKDNPNVTFINMFEASTKLTRDDVQQMIQNSTYVGIFIIKSFRSVSQCSVDINYCDQNTTNCIEKKSGDLPTCECKNDLTKKNTYDTACLFCHETCSEENKKRCVMTAEGVPSCQCLPNSQNQDGKCEPCAFGYSGEECKDNYLAIIVGVAVACAVVIVVLAGVLIYKSLRAKKEAPSETRSLLGNDYSTIGKPSQENAAPNVATNFAATDRIFPRIQSRNPAVVNKTVMDSQGHETRNIHEAGTTNKAYIPERDYDDDDSNTWLEMSSRDRF